MTPIVHPITKSDEKRLSKPPPPDLDYDRLARAMVQDPEEEFRPLPESLDITDEEIWQAHLWAGLWGLVAFFFIIGFAIWYLSRM